MIFRNDYKLESLKYHGTERSLVKPKSPLVYYTVKESESLFILSE